MASSMGYIPNASNKGGPLDAIFTPDVLAHAALLYLSRTFPNFSPQSMLEPGCGVGVHCDQALMVFPSLIHTTAIDIVPRDVDGSHTFICGDFLKSEDLIFDSFDLISTNPPFTYVEDFIRQAWSLLSDGGMGYFLCKYSVAGSLRRHRMWKEINLRHIAMLVPRPSFYGGGTDPCEYSYFLFDRGTPGKPSFNWLPWKQYL